MFTKIDLREKVVLVLGGSILDHAVLVDANYIVRPISTVQDLYSSVDLDIQRHDGLHYHAQVVEKASTFGLKEGENIFANPMEKGYFNTVVFHVYGEEKPISNRIYSPLNAISKNSSLLGMKGNVSVLFPLESTWLHSDPEKTKRDVEMGLWMLHPRIFSFEKILLLCSQWIYDTLRVSDVFTYGIGSGYR